MKRTLFLSLILVLTTRVYAQSPAVLLKTADNLLLDSKYPETVDLVNKNLPALKEPGDKILFQVKKAEALIRSSRYEEAGQLLNMLNEEAAKQRDKDFLGGMVASSSGFLSLNMGRSDRALELSQEAAVMIDRSGRKNTVDGAQVLSNLGLAYFSTRQYSQAEQQLQLALSIRETLGKDAQELVAATYNDLGLVYSQIDQTKALDYYDQSLAIYKKLHGDNHPKVATASLNSGIIYRESELYGDAVNNFETALKIWEAAYPQAHPSKGIALYNLGLTYAVMGNRQAANGYYERALAMYEQVYGKKHPELATVLNSIGLVRVFENKYDEAFRSYQRALIANVSDFNDENTEANPKTENFYSGSVLLYTLLYKAQAYEARYLGKTLKFTELENALALLHECDKLIDRLRQRTSNENDRIMLSSIANEVYGDGIRVATLAGLNAFRHKAKYYEEAFYFAEKSKSAALLQAISESNAKSFAGIPADLLEEEKNLKSGITLAAQRLAQKPNPEEERKIRETLNSLNMKYESFTQRLEKEFPEYFNLKFNLTSPSITQLQQKLDGKSAVLSYFVDDTRTSKRLYIFIITQNDLKVVDHAIGPEFDKYITGFRNGMIYNEIKTFRKSAFELYKLLIPSLPASIKELVILPTGRLSFIPFEALIYDKSKAATNFKALPYLITQYGIRYEFSAGLILQKDKAASASTTQPSIILCAPVTFSAETNLDDLPGTATEVQEISRLFESKNLKASVSLEKQANEGVIKSGALKDYSYVHLATHGIVDEVNPEMSRIYLQNAGSEDGNLFAGEIYNLKLNANLITLSACQTGLGKISAGEGVVGLSRALVYAGARNIIVSFWNVADESTAQMMTDFYSQLLSASKQDYGESLRAAKGKLMRSENYSSPYYWAPFILIGF